jgi:hypothetical protein
MAILNFSGFETGDAGELITLSGSASIQSSVKRTGGFALRVNPATSATGFAIIGIESSSGPADHAGLSTAYFRFYFRFDTEPSADNEEIFAVRDTSGLTICRLRFSSNKNIDVWKNASFLAFHSTILTAGTWYLIEYKQGTGASGAYELKVNGVVGPSGTSDFSATSNIASCYLGKVTNRNSRTIVVYYDDFAWSDSGYLGAGACKRVAPDSAGFYTAWTGAFGDVDEATHDGDTTFISTSTSGAAFTAGLESTTTAGIVGTINAVKSYAVARYTGSATTLTLRTRSGLTNADSTINISGSYVTRCSFRTVDPQDAAPWTVGDIDSAEVGVVADSANPVRVTALGLMVDYVPGVAGSGARSYAVIV